MEVQVWKVLEAKNMEQMCIFTASFTWWHIHASMLYNAH